MQGSLGGTGGAKPALLAESLNDGGVSGRLSYMEAFGRIGAFTHRLRFWGNFFAGAAEVGIKVHDTGEARWGVVVEAASWG